MATIAFTIGGLIGSLTGFIAWGLFGMSVLGAFALYLGLSLGIGAILIAANLNQPRFPPMLGNASIA